MKEISIESWDMFVENVEKLQAERDTYDKQTSLLVPKLLYRGQPDSRMKLETTLERSIPHEISLREYYDFIYIIRAKIESVTGKDWPIPSREKFASRVR